jgi:hypothetical protein
MLQFRFSEPLQLIAELCVCLRLLVDLPLETLNLVFGGVCTLDG